MNWLLIFISILVPITTAHAQTFSPEEQSAIDARIETYIVENPEILLRALQTLQDREAENKEAAIASVIDENRQAIYYDDYSYVGGNVDGDLTLVEFMDYQCGFCRRAHPIVMAFLEDNPDVRYVIKAFPVLGETSVMAAKAAMASLRLEGADTYKIFHDSMMTHDSPLNEATIFKLAEAAGLNIKALKREMAKTDLDTAIKDTYALARKLEIAGTPYFVFDDKILRGVPSVEALNAIVTEVTK